MTRDGGSAGVCMARIQPEGLMAGEERRNVAVDTQTEEDEVQASSGPSGRRSCLRRCPVGRSARLSRRPRRATSRSRSLSEKVVHRKRRATACEGRDEAPARADRGLGAGEESFESRGVKLRCRCKALDVTSVVLARGENLRASFGRPLRRLLSVGPGSLHQPISCPEARASSLSASTDARPARDSHRASGRPLGDERNGHYRLAPDGSERWP